MDSRGIVVNPAIFFSMLADRLKYKDRVSLLVDQEGITRVEGYISHIRLATDVLQAEVSMDSGYRFIIGQVIAVNGIFRSDYSEC